MDVFKKEIGLYRISTSISHIEVSMVKTMLVGTVEAVAVKLTAALSTNRD